MIADMDGRVAAFVAENVEIASGVYRLALADVRGSGALADIAAGALPGQFVNLYLNSSSMLLPRPLSVSDVVDGPDGKRLVLVYAVVGGGTDELSGYAPGSEIRVLGPQGNGYDLDEPERHTLLVGGGLGIPPLLFTAHRLRDRATPGDGSRITALLGYRGDAYYLDEMNQYCDEAFCISESAPGLYDVNGNVMDLLARLVSESKVDLKGARVLSCGPVPMLRAVAEWAKEMDLPAQVSLEERMGCGYGACVGCTIEVRSPAPGDGPDAAPHTVRRKVCKDGPVFPAGSVLWGARDENAGTEPA
jgi:dihydroorotate dehydrogenase electron transfer subunit